MSKRAWGILAVTIVALVVAGWFVVKRANGSASADETQETVTVERGTLQSSVGGTGSLAPATEVNLSFSSGGKVAQVLAAVGDQVEAGQPIAVLDTGELALSLQSAEASLDSARLGASSARASLSELESGTSETDLAVAKIGLDQAKDRLWGTQAQRDGVCGRVERGQGQKYECEGQDASVLQAEDSVRIAELQYEELLAGATNAELSAAREKVSQADAQVTSAEASLEQARLRLEDATLTSPMDGTLTALNLVEGEYAAGSGSASATVSTLDDLEVEIMLDETEVADVDVGMAATVVLDAFPDDELTGEVTVIAPTAQTESGVVLFPVTVNLQPTDVPARPGMTAEVEIVTHRVEDALILPLRAIVSTPRGDFVALVVSEDDQSGDEDSSSASAAGGANAAAGAEAAGADQSGMGPDASGFAPPSGTPGARFAGHLPEGMTQEEAIAMRQTAVASGGGALFGQASVTSQPTDLTTRLVQVTIGARTDTEVQITSGVEEGDVVVVPSTTNGDQQFQGGGFPMPIMGGGVMRDRP